MPEQPSAAEEIFGHGNDQKIRERAYHLWEQDGRPHGGDLEYWERARALIGMEGSAGAGLLANPVPPGADQPLTPPRADEAILEENLGETPGRMTDQGDRATVPIVRRKR